MRLFAAAVASAVLAVAAPSFAQQTPPPASFGYVAPPPVPAPLSYDIPPAGALPPPVTFGPAPADGRDTVTPAAKPESDWHLDIGFGTEAPISVGGVVTAEVPGRVLFQLGLGFMPKGYVSAIDGFLTAVHAYDATVGNLVKSSLGNAFVLRGSAGWRPFKDHGFEITGGYTLMTLGGAATAGDVINAVLAEGGASARLPAEMLAAEIPLAATLHNVHATLGWRWLLADDHLVVRASLSYIQCVAANVGVNLASMGSAGSAAEGMVNQALNGYLTPYFTTYGKMPTMGLSAAYRF